MKKRSALLTLLVASFFLVGCTQAPSVTVNPDQTNTEEKIASNLYDMNAKVGEKYGEMTLEKIDSNISERPVSEGNYKGEFSGQVTLTGEYEYDDGAVSMFGEIACFTITEKTSLQKLPKSALDVENGYENKALFCFSNLEKAKKLLGTTNKSATITISSLIDSNFQGESPDYAELVSVEN